MYWIRCNNGRQIFGHQMPWDRVHAAADECGGIAEAALTDGVNFDERISGADQYLYYAEAISVMRNALGGGSGPTIGMPKCVKETMVGFYKAETMTAKIDAIVKGMMETEKVLATVIGQVKTEIDAATDQEEIDKLNVRLVDARTQQENVKKSMARKLVDRDTIDAAGGQYVILTMTPARLSVNPDEAVNHDFWKQANAGWIGAVGRAYDGQ
ncbi:MAG: hypothetical protein WC455_12260 [Dehalococcoidia bacterium]|jgi:hypothetical protein